MSGKLPAVKPKELIRALEQLGWRLDRVRGSRYILKRPIERRSIPVPVHNRDLATGTLHGILRRVGLSRAELRDLLRGAVNGLCLSATVSRAAGPARRRVSGPHADASFGTATARSSHR